MLCPAVTGVGIAWRFLRFLYFVDNYQEYLQRTDTKFWHKFAQKFFGNLKKISEVHFDIRKLHLLFSSLDAVEAS